MKEVTIYTDGACSGNPGPGGWAAVLVCNGHQKEISGREELTTNNRMELTASIEALKQLKEPCHVHIYSDSAYLVNAFQKKWVKNWKKNGWRTASGRPVENRDLWEELLAVMRPHSVCWHKVEGHRGNPYNERCDRLAKKRIRG
ncbi:ribonuclease H [Thermacetogenium phaeum DSM 12270]|uniref:Ribonuclease H n=1 Tax=Thermacetogenium phaeum (strain ATCC BAA-254 / DSM 26808 / PB) TaxID=1089553 RepID=K4LKY5_THEPS|nr:ribonuclease HI [Thermacetogenium phaeum]AFV12640.1 ribonuclease H [Thermacetogenium phaeum DSM 12270]